MESFRNERSVQQGEDWNLDLLLSASDREYIPYLISSERNNPHFAITVASTKFEKNLRYVKTWWNSVDTQLQIPRFYSTVPVDCGELGYVDPDADELVMKDLPIAPADGTFAEFTNNDSKETRYLYQYTRADEPIDMSVGHKPYHYFYFEYGDEITRVDEYECRLIQNFLSKDTKDWRSQNYLYQITLVSGELMFNVLNDIYEEKLNAGYNLSDYPQNKNWQSTIDTEPELIIARFKYLKSRWPSEFQPDIDETSPLGYIEIPEPILRPTKLEVFNNLRTLI
jgi:hypothetical protein